MHPSRVVGVDRKLSLGEGYSRDSECWGCHWGSVLSRFPKYKLCEKVGDQARGWKALKAAGWRGCHSPETAGCILPSHHHPPTPYAHLHT